MDNFKELLSIEMENLRALLQSQGIQDGNISTNKMETDAENASPTEDDVNEDEMSTENNGSDKDDDLHKIQVVKQMGKVQYFKVWTLILTLL